MMRNKYFAVLGAGLVMACASAGTTQGPSKSSNVITREEIANAHVYNAYDAVQTLRPAFFHSHGATSMQPGDTGQPNVYLNHQLLGNIDSLRQLDVTAIREIHYYNGPEASNRFGMNNVSGAIEVVTDAQ